MQLASKVVWVVAFAATALLFARAWVGGWRPRPLADRQVLQLWLVACGIALALVGAFALGYTEGQEDVRPPAGPDAYDLGWRNGWTSGCLASNGTACDEPPEWGVVTRDR